MIEKHLSPLSVKYRIYSEKKGFITMNENHSDFKFRNIHDNTYRLIKEYPAKDVAITSLDIFKKETPDAELIECHTTFKQVTETL